MNEELMFKILVISIYAVFAGVRVYYRSQIRGRTSERVYTQRTKAIMAFTLAILGYFVSIGLWFVFPKRILVFQLALPLLIRWFGVGVAMISVALTVWIHRVLGRQYSAKWEIQEQHQLITVGPYSKVRHPMYTGFNLFSMSVSLISANLLLILFAVFIGIPFYWISRSEEEMLIDQFGDEYLEYMKHTGRFFPRLFGTEDKIHEKEVA